MGGPPYDQTLVGQLLLGRTVGDGLVMELLHRRDGGIGHRRVLGDEDHAGGSRAQSVDSLLADLSRSIGHGRVVAGLTHRLRQSLKGGTTEHGLDAVGATDVGCVGREVGGGRRDEDALGSRQVVRLETDVEQRGRVAAGRDVDNGDPRGLLTELAAGGSTTATSMTPERNG